MLQVRVVCLYLLAMTALVTQQQLSDAEVLTAIQKGTTKKYSDLISSCSAGAGFGASMANTLATGVVEDGAYSVSVSSAAGRIATLAADAKRLYKPFTLEDVTPAMRSMEAVFVVATPLAPKAVNQHVSIAASIDAIVLKSKTDPNVVLQPTDLQISPVEWGNLMGGKVSGTAGVGTFSMKGLRDFPAGDIDVVLITTTKGEWRCKIGAKDRAVVIR